MSNQEQPQPQPEDGPEAKPCNPAGLCSCCRAECDPRYWYCDTCARDLPAMFAPAYRGQMDRRLPALRNALQYGRFGPT